MAADPGTTPTAAVPTTYCGHCGDPLATGEHAACARRLELEPPRYCASCRRRMVVQVTPTAWTARCVQHGATGTGAGAGAGTATGVGTGAAAGTEGTS